MNEILAGIGRKSFKKFLDDQPEMTPIDHSRLELWDQCHRKFHYITERGLYNDVGAIAQFSKYLIHPMLGGWYAEGNDFSHDDKWWRKQNKLYNDALSQHNIRLSKRDMDSLTVRTAQMLFAQYVTRFAVDRDMYDFVAVEELYWSTIPGADDFVWFTIPDLTLERKTDRKLVTNDFKLSRWDIQAELNTFDRQFLGQAFGAKASFMMKSHMQLRIDPDDRRPYDTTLTRTFEPVEHDLMNEWMAELLQSLDEMRSAKKSQVYVKRAPRTCQDFNKPCTFIELCRIGPTREMLIPTWEHHDPMEYVWENANA